MIMILDEACFENTGGQVVNEVIFNTEDWILVTSWGSCRLLGNKYDDEWSYRLSEKGYKKVKDAMINEVLRGNYERSKRILEGAGNECGRNKKGV